MAILKKHRLEECARGMSNDYLAEMSQNISEINVTHLLSIELQHKNTRLKSDMSTLWKLSQ